MNCEPEFGSDALFSMQEGMSRNVIDYAENPEFAALSNGQFQRQVVAPEGIIYQGDSISWLQSIESESVDLIFADPPYNIKKASWDNFESHEAYIEWSLRWIAEASRVLKPTGSMYICGFSEILADLKYLSSKYFATSRWLIWHYKNKANLGNDWGRSHESILHLRKSKKFRIAEIDYLRIPYGAHTLKYPSRQQAVTSAYGKGKKQEWSPHPMGAKPKDVIEIPTTCNGMNEKTPHPTQKPEELLRKLIFAGSHPGDLVLDPFSGSGTTAVVSAQLGRKFLACDLDQQYNSWAAQRLQRLQERTPEEWFEYDRAIAQRRGAIR